jgi:hypothetical protein
MQHRTPDTTCPTICTDVVLMKTTWSHFNLMAGRIGLFDQAATYTIFCHLRHHATDQADTFACVENLNQYLFNTDKLTSEHQVINQSVMFFRPQ